jgi:hypothetical protein
VDGRGIAPGAQLSTVPNLEAGKVVDEWATLIDPGQRFAWPATSPAWHCS